MMTSNFSAGDFEPVNCWIVDGKAACSGHPWRTQVLQREEVMKDVQQIIEWHKYKMEQLQEWLVLAQAEKWSETHPSDGKMIVKDANDTSWPKLGNAYNLNALP